MKKIAITMGDPAGIGPEIILKSLNSNNFDLNEIILIANKEIMRNYASELKIKMSEKLEIIDIPFNLSLIKTGIESVQGGELSYLALEKACKMAQNGLISSIVTAPLSKNAINMAGYHYSGQTEILEKFLGTNEKNKAEMLFIADDFKILLLTRHIKLEDVSSSLTQEKIIQSAKILVNSLKSDFKIPNPKVAICGLNPHAGEGGLLGEEETKNIIPAIKYLKENKIDIEGPFPADTLFAKAGKAYLNNLKQPFDCYLACYHDQGLIPVKMLAMEKTVNTTIGLPVIRTSPAHGTAFDIAGKNKADFRSMTEAIKLGMLTAGSESF